MGGGKGGGGSTKASAYEKTMAKIANALFEESTPLRQDLTSQYEDFAAGNYNPEELPGYAPLYSTSRAGMEDQYNVAKENVISNTASGGALTSALSDLETSRAQEVGSLPATISSSLVNDLMNKSYGVAYQTPSTAIQGLSAASTAQQSRLNRAAQQQTQSGGLLGDLAGALTMGLVLK